MEKQTSRTYLNMEIFNVCPFMDVILSLIIKLDKVPYNLGDTTEMVC